MTCVVEKISVSLLFTASLLFLSKDLLSKTKKQDRPTSNDETTEADNRSNHLSAALWSR